MRLLVRLNLTAALFLAIGCSPSGPEPDLSAILSEPEELSAREEADRLEFDFGSILARDQTLRHDFRVANRSDRPLRVVGSKVKVPCCSKLGKLPDSIEPGGEATMPVFLKVGHAADRKRVAFEIETNSPSLPILTLFVTARFVPDWEVEETPGDRGPLKIGQSSTRTYRVVGRRKAGEGLRAPTEINATGDLGLESASAPAEVEGSDGIIESSRVVTVNLREQSMSGDKLGSLAFRWPNGLSRVMELRWSVKPSLQLFPPTLILKTGSEPVEASVDVRSGDLPFRVVKVSGGLITEDVKPSDRAETSQTLRITLDPSRVTPGVKPTIEIVTDHPDQPTLTLGLVILPPTKGGSE